MASPSPALAALRVHLPQRRSVLVRAVALGATYAGLSKLIAVVTAFGNTSGATFWPGAGLTLAVLLRRPRSEWPYYLLAVAVAEAATDVSLGFGVAVGAGWAVANTAEPLLAALLLRRLVPRILDLGRRADLAWFALAGIVIGPFAGALIGAATGALLGGDPWMPRLARWYVGDAMGVLLIAPALLILWQTGWRPPGRTAGSLLLALTLVTLVAVAPWRFTAAAGLPFLAVPLLTLIALRSGMRGAAAGVLIVATIVQAITAEGHGPFADDAGAFHGLVIAQMFLAMCAVTTYTVAVLAGELVSRTQVEDELRDQALRDSLTGLANRRLLFDRIAHASRRLLRKPGTVALLFIDLDNFKTVNDTYGHAVGDRVLVASADRLREVVRDQDSIARIGGDEFLVLAEDLSSAGDALNLAARIVAVFDEPFDAGGELIQLTASVGIATTSVPIADPAAYLSGADRAMYTAKRAGGHRIATAERL